MSAKKVTIKLFSTALFLGGFLALGYISGQFETKSADASTTIYMYAGQAGSIDPSLPDPVSAGDRPANIGTFTNYSITMDEERIEDPCNGSYNATTSYDATMVDPSTSDSWTIQGSAVGYDGNSECFEFYGDITVVLIPTASSGNIISGTLYLADGTTADTTSRTLRLSRNGGASQTVTTTGGTGAFSFEVSDLASGDVVTIWIDGGSLFGTTVLRYGASCTGTPDCTGIPVVRDQVRLENKHTGEFANSAMASCDNDSGTGCNTGNVGFTSNSGTLTVSSGRTLFVPSGVTFNSGGTVTTPALNVAGTVNGTSNITVNGNVSGNGSIAMTGGTFLVDGTSSFGGNTAWSFNHLTFGDGSGFTTTTASGSGAITVAGQLTIASQQTLNAGSKTWNLTRTSSTPMVVSGTFTASSSTVNYNPASSSSVTVAGTTYNIVNFNSSSSTFTLGGTLTTGSGTTLTISAGTLNANGNTINVGGSWSNSGTFTHGSGTVNFTSTSTGRTLAGTLSGTSSFYNVNFTGSGGGWSNSSAMVVANDLTVSAGTFSGSQNVTVNGGDVTGNGTITRTGGTFLVDGVGNFGGNSAWSFTTLTFGDGSGATTTTGTGTGSITVSGVLTIAANQTLNAGSKTWILSGTGTPFVRNGTFTPAQSTFQYTGSTATVTATTFKNLTLGGTGTYTMPASAMTIAGNLVISTNANITKGAGTITFASNELQTYTDNNGTTRDIGNVVVASAAGQSWCNISSSACNANWLNRKQITFDNSASSSNLTDFPILVVLNSTNIDYTKTQNNGQDIRFVDSNNSTALSYQIEQWDENGTSLIWVKVPQLDMGSSDYIWMYYNNVNATDNQSANSVWNEGYRGVFHLNDNAANTTVVDSRGVGNATFNNNTNSKSVAGFIGRGIQFTQGTEDITTGLNSTAALTWETWFKADVFNNYHSLIVLDDGNFMLLDLSSSAAASLWLHEGYYGNDFGATGLSTGQWYHLALTREGNNVTNGLKVYLNGNLTGQANSGVLNVGGPIHFGLRPGTGQPFYGVLDEARISNVARSADWMRASYLSMTNQMNTFGTEEGNASTALRLNTPARMTTLTVNSGQRVEVNGSHTLTLTGNGTAFAMNGTFNAGTGTVAYDSASTTGTTVAVANYYNLTLNRASNTFTAASGMRIDNDFILSAGTFIAPASGKDNELTIGGNFTINGTFNHNGGTVLLVPSKLDKTINIGGSQNVSFSTLLGITPGTIVRFANGRTYSFGSLSMTGANGAPILLYSSTNGAQWIATLSSVQLSYVAIRDAACSGGSTITPNERIFNHGNLGACWAFIGRGGAANFTAPEGGGAGSGGSVGGGQGAGGGGGGNVQATATATVFFGSITDINITEAGSGYTVEPLVCVQGDGTGAVLEAEVRHGALNTISIIEGGFGYSYANVVIAAPGTGGGTCGAVGGGGAGGGSGGGSP